MFHVVTSGRCVLGCEGLPRITSCSPAISRSCRTVPATGWRASLECAAAKLFDLPREQVSDRYEILRHGGGGAPTTVICGVVRFDHPAADRLVTPAAQRDRRRRVELARGGVDPEHAAIDGDRGQRAASWRRDRDHAARRHPGHPGHPILDCERSSRPDRMARCASGQADRPRHCPRPSRTRASMDGRVAGERGRDVPLGICRALYGAGWRASDALRRALAHACRLDVAERRRCTGQRDGESSRLRVGGRVQPGVQAISRVPSGGRSTGEVRSIDASTVRVNQASKERVMSTTTISTMLLWLFVINLGIAFGAGVYEHRIVTPDWLNHDGSGSHWNAETARRDDTGLRFWAYVTTGPLTLLTLASLVVAWRTTGPERGWWLAAALAGFSGSGPYVLVFHPDDDRVDERSGFACGSCRGDTVDEFQLSAPCPRARCVAGRTQSVRLAISGPRLTARAVACLSAESHPG